MRKTTQEKPANDYHDKMHVACTASGAYGLAILSQLAISDVDSLSHHYPKEPDSKFRSIIAGTRDEDSAEKLNKVRKSCLKPDGTPFLPSNLNSPATLEKYIRENSFHYSKLYITSGNLPKYPIPIAIKASANPGIIAGSAKGEHPGDWPSDEQIAEYRRLAHPEKRILFSTVPSAGLEESSKRFSEHWDPASLLVSTTKGLSTGGLALESLKHHFGAERLAVFSGPGLAINVANGSPLVAVIGTQSNEDFQTLVSIKPEHWRLIQSNDVIGVEVCGFLKNIYSFAFGISKSHDDAFSSMEACEIFNAQVFQEMEIIVAALGGNRNTVHLPCGEADYRLSTMITKQQEMDAKLYFRACKQFHGLHAGEDVRSTTYQDNLQKYLTELEIRKPSCGRNVLLGIGLGQGNHLKELTSSVGLTFEGLDSLENLIPMLEQKIPSWRTQLPILNELSEVTRSGTAPDNIFFNILGLERLFDIRKYGLRINAAYPDIPHSGYWDDN